MKISDRAIGFRVKSGYAIAVVLEGSRRSPAAVSRHIVQLCDPAKAELASRITRASARPSRIRARSLPA